MPFGKHFGRPLCAVPVGYIRWCLRSIPDLEPGLRGAMVAELRRRAGAPVRPDRPAAFRRDLAEAAARHAGDPAVLAELVHETCRLLDVAEDAGLLVPGDWLDHLWRSLAGLVAEAGCWRAAALRRRPELVRLARRLDEAPHHN